MKRKEVRKKERKKWLGLVGVDLCRMRKVWGLIVEKVGEERVAGILGLRFELVTKF